MPLSCFVLILIIHQGGLLFGNLPWPWGKTYCFQRLSPNKTVEGVVGQISLGALLLWLLRHGATVAHWGWMERLARVPIMDSAPEWYLLGAFLIAACILGDLCESFWKRSIGVKDSGTLFGPHGGLMDKNDSLCLQWLVLYFFCVSR